MVLADANFRLDAQAVDYVLLAFYFVIVLGIGLPARVLGIVFGLGFVLSFGYWTTNFAEV